MVNHFSPIWYCKGISFLPRIPRGAYAQMPIEAISSEQYENIIPRKNLKVDFSNVQSKDESDPDVERYCDSSICVLDPVASGK